ncbi:VOC family protein [Xanthomonas sacchari]|uniref:VOC family protein n=1 Tax=Xanthomonas sacchari TaxID=56458 RepID=UPI00225E0FD4|nr:VOC family protein [Xanthomonas sacchari]UYK80830.1 VOC family protein [Xanthomonas sacchari]
MRHPHMSASARVPPSPPPDSPQTVYTAANRADTAPPIEGPLRSGTARADRAAFLRGAFAMSSPIPAPVAVRFGRLAPTVPVAEIARAVAFYTERLGFRSVFQNGNPVGFVILKKDDAELHLTLRPDHRGSTSNVAHLMVDDAAALYDGLQAQGVRIIKAIRDPRCRRRPALLRLRRSRRQPHRRRPATVAVSRCAAPAAQCLPSRIPNPRPSCTAE